MATYEELQLRVYQLLGDELQQGTSEELYLDAIQAAHDAILPWIPKTATDTVDKGSGVYTLPTDCYTVEAVVVDSTGEILPNALLSPGTYRGANISGTNDWIEYPYGSLSFSKERGETYTLFYLATWTKPDESTQPTDPIEPPDHAVIGMALYAAAYAMLPQSVGSSEIRQFNQRIDSGNPEHNPLQKSATFFLSLFRDEMNRHPKYHRAQK